MNRRGETTYHFYKNSRMIRIRIKKSELEQLIFNIYRMIQYC